MTQINFRYFILLITYHTFNYINSLILSAMERSSVESLCQGMANVPINNDFSLSTITIIMCIGFITGHVM